jgi:hypothetical protein
LATISYGDDDTGGVAVAVDDSGRKIAAFEAVAHGNSVAVLARYTSSGELDTSFGSVGFVEVAALGEYGQLCCIAIDSRGRIVAAGTVDESTELDAYRPNAFVTRLLNDGSADETFGRRGIAYPSSNELTEGTGLTLDDKDRPYMTGATSTIYSPYRSEALFHFNLDGNLNKAVGFQGTYTTAVGFSSTYGTSLLIDPYGRPTLTAIAYDSDSRQVPVLIRYDEMFGDGFD